MPKPSAPNPAPDRDRAITLALTRWFHASARDLPWRHELRGQRDPYRSLVSEFMLQQTQVSRVLEKFEPFLTRFPTLTALAEAPESEVLAAWSGLGYYRRARLLHACAQAIVRDFHAAVPRDVPSLQQLPGIGRYTAGAIASIVFDQPEPIVDGNVCRVLQRLDAKPGSASQKDVIAWAWQRAESLVKLCSVSPSQREGASRHPEKASDAATPAAFNEGLMELGALVCTPAAPKCHTCPLRDHCAAHAQALVDDIPAPKPRAARARVHHDVALLWRRTASDIEVLLEQRPASGLWASLWQPPAIENAKKLRRTASSLLEALAIDAVPVQETKPRSSAFQTTHREIRFRVWIIEAAKVNPAARRWFPATSLSALAISNAHRALLELLPANSSKPSVQTRRDRATSSSA
ncbi:MAG: A/G-specific adenine glycosylase [Phycisphaerales bacterium]|nr:A/G-specific adenine glycosylase [Phycisphaerales bacterium]